MIVANGTMQELEKANWIDVLCKSVWIATKNNQESDGGPK